MEQDKLWKLLITKTFFIQFLNLDETKQTYVLQSMRFLRNVLDLDSKPEYDIIDEYESSEVESKPFPLTYHVDHDEQKIFLICIEASYQNDSN